MATSLQSPKILANTFCNDGDKTSTIPVTATGTNACSLEEGFPAITSTAVSGGGIPPKRTDFNGIFSLLSEYCFYLQNGGTFSFDSNISTAIGGYPEGAILLYVSSSGAYRYIKSLISNNTNEPSSSNIKYPNSDTGTYYWEAISNVEASLFLINNDEQAVKSYAGMSLDNNGYLHINGTTGLAFDNSGNIGVASGLLNISFTNIKVNNNPLLRLPNYASKTQVASSTSNTESSWTATADGWVEFVTATGTYPNTGDNAWIKINGNNIYNQPSSYLPSVSGGGSGVGATIFGIYPIKSGDVIKVRRGFTAYFYPYL